MKIIIHVVLKIIKIQIIQSVNIVTDRIGARVRMVNLRNALGYQVRSP